MIYAKIKALNVLYNIHFKIYNTCYTNKYLCRSRIKHVELSQKYKHEMLVLYNDINSNKQLTLF